MEAGLEMCVQVCPGPTVHAGARLSTPHTDLMIRIYYTLPATP